MPLAAKRNGGKIVIVNLQTTKHDKKCDLKINTYVDTVMVKLCAVLGVPIPDWPGPHITLQSIHTLKTEKRAKVTVHPSLLLQNILKKELKTEVKAESKQEVKATVKSEVTLRANSILTKPVTTNRTFLKVKSECTPGKSEHMNSLIKIEPESVVVDYEAGTCEMSNVGRGCRQKICKSGIINLKAAAPNISYQTSNSDDTIQHNGSKIHIPENRMNITEKSTANPQRVDVTEKSTNKPQRADITENSTADPQRVDITENSTANPQRVDITENSTADPQRVDITENSTADPQRVDITENSTADPQRVDITENSTADPQRVDISENSTADPQKQCTGHTQSGMRNNIDMTEKHVTLISLSTLAAESDMQYMKSETTKTSNCEKQVWEKGSSQSCHSEDMTEPNHISQDLQGQQPTKKLKVQL